MKQEILDHINDICKEHNINIKNIKQYRHKIGEFVVDKLKEDWDL